MRIHLHLCPSVVSTLFLTFFPATLPAARVILVAGGGEQATGLAISCKLRAPFAVDFDRSGNLYIAEMNGGERILKVEHQRILTVLAGTGHKGASGDGGPARLALFNGVHSLAVGPWDHIFVADTLNNRIRMIDPKPKMVYPFAGTGRKGFSGDGGPAVAAEFGSIYCVAFDSRRENLFLADLDNRRIRAVNLKSGIVKTVAGNGEKGTPPDGAEAAKAPLVDPRAVAIDSKGNLYILERSGHALRRVDADGKIRTVAGTGNQGFAGDGGEALKASFSGPKHICVDSHDNVIIADTDNHVIRKYLPREYRVVRLAGTGESGSEGIGGPPEKLKLNQPHGVYVDQSDTLYIADSLNNRVLKIER